MYVAVHMPHSRSKRHNRHKRKHKHGNGRSHHDNGHDRHSNGHDDHDGDGEDQDALAEQIPEKMTPAPVGKVRVPRISLDMSSPVREDWEEGQPRYKKSHSLPAGHFSTLPDSSHFLAVPSKIGE